jgi:hypothetical protein
MLRRPSELPGIRREEGCSSTAFDSVTTVGDQVWNSPAYRGSWSPTVVTLSAVP